MHLVQESYFTDYIYQDPVDDSAKEKKPYFKSNMEDGETLTIEGISTKNPMEENESSGFSAPFPHLPDPLSCLHIKLIHYGASVYLE